MAEIDLILNGLAPSAEVERFARGMGMRVDELNALGASVLAPLLEPVMERLRRTPGGEGLILQVLRKLEENEGKPFSVPGHEPFAFPRGTAERLRRLLSDPKN